jgi:RNA polymerase primary sigma factor
MSEAAMYSNEHVLEPDTVNFGETKQSTEHSNFEIADRMEAGKIKLINILAQFPAAALWLLHQYEALADHPELSSSAAALSEIKNRFLLASLSFSARGFSRDTECDQKQCLTEALQAFPFSYEDLSILTEIVVYIFQARNICDQLSEEHAGPVAKRLAKSNRCGKLNLSDLIEAMHGSRFDRQFLFLSDTEMLQLMPDLVGAENLWLSSRRQLAEANSGLVLFIANQFRCGFLDFDDLVQEGQTGLLKAIDKFDGRLGFQFSTYAAYWIKQAISRASSRCERVVRVPCEQVANLSRVRRAKSDLYAKTGREPTVDALAGYLKIPVEQINAILTVSQTAVPLENLDDDTEELAPIDFLEQQVFAQPFKKIEQSELKAWIGKAVKILDPRELKVICYHFGISTGNEMTLQEIGTELHLTRERVRQIQVKALDKMKHSYGEQLVSFL